MPLEWKCLFRYCLDCFTFCFVWNSSCLPGVLVFNSKVFDLTGERFGKFVVLFPSGGSPINGTSELLASEWGKSQHLSGKFSRILSRENPTA